MRLDVLIATYNRADLLARALESLLAADRPAAADLTVTVVDNRSTDDTRSVVASFMPRFDGRLKYLYESQPGRSHALNAGIAATNAELVAMIDDDEEVDRNWLVTIEKAFADPSVDFIGGPYVPRWGGERPAWLGTAYKAAVGWVDGGSQIAEYGPQFAGMLMGGNAVIRRSVLKRVGPYALDVGRSSDGRLLSCEDRDMFSWFGLVSFVPYSKVQGFAVDRDHDLRPDPADHVDKLGAARMSRHVDELRAVGDHLDALGDETVDHAVHRLLVAGDHAGGEDHAIAPGEGDLGVSVLGDARERGARLALASGA